MSRYNEVGKHATTVIRNGASIEVYYHGTCVVRATEDRVTLDTGNVTSTWNPNRPSRGPRLGSVTTVRRMNQASEQYGLGFRVWVQRKEIYISTAFGQYQYEGKPITFDRRSGALVR